MEKPMMMRSEVFETLKQIQQRNIEDTLYGIVWKNEKAFLKMGVSLDEIFDVIESKNSATDYPNPDFYQVYDQWRSIYIHNNLANPEIELRGENEREYLMAMNSWYSWKIDYEQKADQLSKTVSKAFEELGKEQDMLEQEGLSSWKGIRYQTGKLMEKIGLFLWGENEPEALNLSESEEAEIENQEEILAKEDEVSVIEQAAVLEPEKIVDRNVMVDNYKLWTLTDEQKIASDHSTVLRRIQATKDMNYLFGVDVVKGELGGWIESENNLQGNSWVGDNAEVFGQAKVVDSVVVDNAIVKDEARVTNDSCIAGNAQVTDAACIANSIIADDARISDFSVVVKTPVDGYSSISGDSYVYDCTCFHNTHIVNSKIHNVDMSGDIHVEAREYGYGEGEDDRDRVDYVRPGLLDNAILEKLRAHPEGLKGEVLCSRQGVEFIADLNLVRGIYLSMNLAVSNPVIRCKEKCYDGQKLLDNFREIHYPIDYLQPGRLMDLFAGTPHILGGDEYIIRQVGEEFTLENVTEKLDNTNEYSHRKSDTMNFPADENQQETEGTNEGQSVDANLRQFAEKYPADTKLKSLFVFCGEEKIASDQVTVLHRIQANRDLSFIGKKDVPEGTLGGWVESERNLSGYSWVGDNAEVYGGARVINSVILGNSIVRDDAVVKESTVWKSSVIEDDAEVGESLVSGHAHISGSSVLDKSVFSGYGSVGGKSYLENCYCCKNVHVVDSQLQNISMEGDFLLRDKSFDCKTEGGKLSSLGYTPPALIDDSMLEVLRAHPKGLKGVSLCNVEGKEFIADLNLEVKEGMQMKLVVSNPIIRCDGINYNGRKITDKLTKLNRDIAGIHPNRLVEMMRGEPLLIRSILYAIQKKGNEYELADLRKCVNDIEIYSLIGGGMSIRCKIDGVQQGGKVLSAEVIRTLNDRVDRRALAVEYFMGELRENREVEHSMRR